MEAIFLFIYRYYKEKRAWLLALVLIIAGVAAYLASRIAFEEDISRMISGSNGENTMTKAVEQAKFLEKIVITISPADTGYHPGPDELIAYGNMLADTLQDSVFMPYVKSVTYKVSDTLVEDLFSAVHSSMPIFLEPQDYRYIDTMILPGKIRQSIERSYRNLLSPVSFPVKQMILHDPVGIGTPVLNRLRAFQNDENYTLLNGCIFSRDQQNLMMFITPVFSSNQTSRNAVFVRNLDDAIHVLDERTGNKLEAAYFGSSVVAVGNAERLKKDIRIALTITLVLLALIINFSVKKKKLFPFIFLPAVFGGLIAMAVLYLFHGKVSVISLSIGTVILAITVDYALHITTHYKHKHSIIETIRDVSFPIMVCGIATAFEFLALVFVSSESLHELGILAAVSVVTAAFFTLVVLPHILDVTHSRTDETEVKNYLERVLDRITNYDFHKNRILVACMLIFSFVAVFYVSRVGFEDNMMKMNYMSPELTRIEDNLNRINNYKLHSIYVVAYGNTLQEALRSNEKVLQTARKLKTDGSVSSFNSPSSLLMSDSLQQTRIDLWNTFWKEPKRETFLATLEENAVHTGFRPNSFTEFAEMITRNYTPIDSTAFSTLQSLFFVDNITVTPELATIVTMLKVENANKNTVPDRFKEIPGVVVVDRKSVLSHIVSTLGNDFNFIANVSLGLILVVLIVAFGRLELGFITFVPIFLSWVWTLGVMGMTGIKFNIFNIIISSFITGLGIDYSIYIMQGLVQGFKSDNKSLLSYKTCILVSVMISISGTGVLILAKHPALNSIALISIIGLLSVVLISYTAEPILFNWLISKRGKARAVPVTLSDILATILVFGIFVAGSLFLNLLLMLSWIVPAPVHRKKLFLHQCLSFACKLPVYAMVHIRKSIVNHSGENFRQPAVIISNHQSHIDLLLLLMLNPKTIVLTNKWVWNNPIYALVIRYLEFYPVMGGYEEIPGKLKASIQQGYSIIVFPEGSRSPDAGIKRFHKGAFLIAEKTGLDILPIFIHGAGDCMNKGENHLKPGSVTVNIYPRIGKDDPSFGKDYHERTKSIQAFYRKEWLRIREELETPGYFRVKLVRNYIFKGPVLEWYTRVKLKLENNYALINSYIPRNARIVDIGCGYGYLSHMLAFVSPERQILGIDYDAGKIEIASNCISKQPGTSFIAADITGYPFAPCDVFILSDVLHYLRDDQQAGLLRECIRNLNPGGVILVRDADKDLERRHYGTRYTEFFSTRSGFNMAKNNRLYFFSGRMIREIAREQGLGLEIIDNSRFTSNVLFAMKKQ